MSSPRKHRVLRFILFSLVALITLVILAGSLISYTGRREWAATKAELLARGEKLSPADLAPPPILDDENFFADPLWAEAMDRIDGKLRVPYGERTLDILSSRNDMPPELADRIDAALRVSRFQRARGATRITAASALSSELQETTDPAVRAELAALILEILEPEKPILARIAALLERPGARAPMDYSLGSQIPVDHVTYLLWTGKALSVRAIAYLGAGQPDAAKADILNLLRLAGTVKSEPMLISQLLRLSMLGGAVGAINHGIASHAWNEDALAAFEHALSQTDVLAQIRLALRGERANYNAILESLHAGASTDQDNVFRLINSLNDSPQRTPSFAEQLAYLALFRTGDQAVYNRSIQEYIDALEPGRRIDPANFPDLKAKWQTAPFASLSRYFTLLAADALWNSVGKFVRTTCEVAMCRIACALERDRLENGKYPDSLAALAPKFLAAVPEDPIAGQSWHYERDGDAFRLWSNGWNRTDENGAPQKNFANADWVWNKH